MHPSIPTLLLTRQCTMALGTVVQMVSHTLRQHKHQHQHLMAASRWAGSPGCAANGSQKQGKSSALEPKSRKGKVRSWLQSAAGLKTPAEQLMVVRGWEALPHK